MIKNKQKYETSAVFRAFGELFFWLYSLALLAEFLSSSPNLSFAACSQNIYPLPFILRQNHLPSSSHTSPCLATWRGWRQGAAAVLQPNAWARRWQGKNCTGGHRVSIFWNARFGFCSLNNTEMHNWLGLGFCFSSQYTYLLRSPVHNSFPYTATVPAGFWVQLPPVCAESTNCAFFSLFTARVLCEAEHLLCHLSWE